MSEIKDQGSEITKDELTVGDVVVIGEQSAEVIEVDVNENNIKYAIVRWHEEQKDSNSFAVINLDGFHKEKVNLL